MNENYAEWLVKRKVPVYAYLLDGVLVLVTILIALLTMVNNLFLIVPTVMSGILTYMVHRNLRVEYEYLFVDRTFSVDRIFGQTKRKEAFECKLESIQMIAPEGSPALNDYKRSNQDLFDYSSHMPDATVYAMMIQSGDKSAKLLFEPDEKMLHCIRQMAPRKVVME